MKKYQHETWYLLVDGTHADPNDVAPNDKGVLVHKNGVPVAMRESAVPHTVGHDAVANKNVEAAEAGREAVKAAEDQNASEATAMKAGAKNAAEETEVNPATGNAAVDASPADQKKKREAEAAEQAKKPASRDMKPERGGKYHTR